MKAVAEPRMYSASLIAAWFVNKGIEEKKYVTQMKLQKMLYFAQGLALNKFGKSLINEEFEAWKYGPVIPQLYNTYRIWGAQPITEPTQLALVQDGTKMYDVDVFTDDVEETLQLAWETTKDISGETLSRWTHEKGSPWHKNFTEGENSKIPNTAIKQYFDKLLKTSEGQHEQPQN